MSKLGVRFARLLSRLFCIGANGARLTVEAKTFVVTSLRTRHGCAMIGAGMGECE